MFISDELKKDLDVIEAYILNKGYLPDIPLEFRYDRGLVFQAVASNPKNYETIPRDNQLKDDIDLAILYAKGCNYLTTMPFTKTVLNSKKFTLEAVKCYFKFYNSCNFTEDEDVIRATLDFTLNADEEELEGFKCWLWNYGVYEYKEFSKIAIDYLDMGRFYKKWYYCPWFLEDRDFILKLVSSEKQPEAFNWVLNNIGITDKDFYKELLEAYYNSPLCL